MARTTGRCRVNIAADPDKRTDSASRVKINWKIKKERYGLLDRLYPMIVNWEGQLPNLRDIFRPEQIDRLLCDCIDHWNKREDSHRAERLVKFVIRTGYKDEPEDDEDGSETLLRRTTAVHHAARHYRDEHLCRDFRVRGFAIVPELFEIYDRFDVNYSDEFGLTHFHVACMAAGCRGVVEKFLDLGQDPDCLATQKSAWVDPPLHLALWNERKRVVGLLLRRGADANLGNARGSTPLHSICWKRADDRDSANTTLFEICDELNRPLRIDARDAMGATPLHLALLCNYPIMAEMLLRRGADPNVANEEGTTPLHVACEKVGGVFFMRSLFESCDRRNLTLLVDARDKLGNTPLHLSLKHSPVDKKRAIELLLSRGADPNLANEKGYAPLHTICDNCHDDNEHDLAKMLFDICDVYLHKVEVDARDNRGRTPLQLAVTNLLPDLVDVLLDRGADLANFVFPAAGQFAERSGPEYYNVKLGLASGLLGCVERLEKAGYELDRGDVLAIVAFFADRGLFDRPSAGLCSRCGRDTEEDNTMKRVTIKPDVSLVDLIERIRLHESTKAMEYTKYLKWANWSEWWNLPEELVEVCTWHLCDIMGRGLFRKWALYPFWELIHYRLPLEVSEMVVERLASQDLMNVCLAVEGLRRKIRENNATTSVKRCNNERPARARKAPKKL